MSCPKLKIPWPRVIGENPPNVDHDQENWKAVERWSDGILKCIPAPGSAQVYCRSETVTVSMTGGTGSEDGGGQTITITGSEDSTVGIFMSFQVSDHTDPHLLSGSCKVDGFFTLTAKDAGAGYDGSYYSSASLNSAGTFGAGTYTFYPSVTVEDGVTTGDVEVFVFLTLVVGADTADSCLQSIG